MSGVDRREPASACVLVEGTDEAKLLHRLLAYADVPFTVKQVSGDIARNRPLPELFTGHELIIVFVMSRRPPAKLVSAIAEVSRASKPVILLTANRAIAAAWPAALHNLPVVFGDGDPEAIGKRLRATVQLLISDHEKALAAQARRAERAQQSVHISEAARSEISPSHRRHTGEELTLVDALVEDIEVRYSRLVDQARTDLGRFLEQKFDVLLVPHLGNRALESPGEATGKANMFWPSLPGDAAIWVDVLGSPSFNPVLVRYGHGEGQKYELQEGMFDLDLLFGIFVHDDGDPEWDISNDSIVVSIGIRQLARYSKLRFRKLMVETRDRLVLSQR